MEMSRNTKFATYYLQRDDPHRLDDFFEEVVQNSLKATEYLNRLPHSSAPRGVRKGKA